MLSTYKAILRGNRVEWRGDVDAHVATDQAIVVHITILDEPLVLTDTRDQGRRMAEILGRLAKLRTFSDVVDPAQWEREVRQERTLPGRET